MTNTVNDHVNIIKNFDDSPKVAVTDQKDLKEDDLDGEQRIPNENPIKTRRGISQFFANKLTADPNNVVFFERKIRKYEDKIERKQKEVKRQEETISKIKEQIDSLRRCTSEKRAASMKSMNLNLQLELTPTIKKKNDLMDKYTKLMNVLEQANERETNLIRQKEQVKLRGRRVRVSFHASAEKLEHEIENWKIPIIRMDFYGQIFENGSSHISKIFIPEEGVCVEIRNVSVPSETLTTNYCLSLLEKYNEFNTLILENKEIESHQLDKVKEGIDDFHSLSKNIMGHFNKITSALSPLLIMIDDFETDALSRTLAQLEVIQAEQIEQIEVSFDISQHLLQTWKVLYLWLRSRLVSLLNDFKGDNSLFLNKDCFFGQFFERHHLETVQSSCSESDSESHRLKTKNTASALLVSREDKLNEVDRLKRLLEEHKNHVAYLRQTLSLSRKKSRQSMLTKINQMNTMRSHISNSASRLQSLEEKKSTLTLSQQEHEGRIKILKIMLEKESTGGTVNKSILWSFAEEKKL